jgi:predicted nucleic acid-binding protein
MFPEPGVIDANVLAYAANADVPHHVASRTLIAAAGDPQTKLYVTSQVLCECYSIFNASDFERFSELIVVVPR